MRVDALRALVALGATCWRPSRRTWSVPERPAPRRGAVQEGGGDGERSAGGARRAARPPPDVTAIYRRVWAEAPLRGLGRPRRRAARADRRGAARRRGGGRARAHRGRVGVARDGAVRPATATSNRRPAFTAALTAPGLDADLECRARFHRAQSVWKQRQRPRAAPLFDEAEAACARAGEPRPARQGAVPGGALLRQRRGTATARWRATRASRPSTPTTATPTTRACARRSWRPTRATSADRGQAAGGDPDPLPEGRPAERGAVAAGVLRLARRARCDEALRWLDENLRLVPHEEIWYAEGRVQYWKGRVFEKQGQARRGPRLVRARRARVPAVGLRAAVADAASRPSIPSAAEGAGRRRCARGCTTSRPGRSRRAPLYGDPGFLRAVELARMGQGGDARRELARLGLATSAEKHAPARPRARRRGSRLDHGHPARSRGRLERVALPPPLRDDQLQASSTRRGSARRSGSSPTRAPSRRWSPRTPRPTSCPRRCSWRSCARRARSRRASNRSPTPSG